MTAGRLIRRTPDPEDARSSRVALTGVALLRRPEAIGALLQGNREALDGFTDAESEPLVGFLIRLMINLDQLATPTP